MADTNVGQIDHAQPGPIDVRVLSQQVHHRSKVIWNGQDPGPLTCRSRSEEFSNLEPMVDDRVVDIIKGLGLEGLLRTPGREIDHGLITALVERWRPETHTFHMPHGEVTITMQDVEVLLGLPVDGEAITGSTQKVWQDVCRDFLGFPINDNTEQLTGQMIDIKRLLERVASPLPPNAEEDQLHKYARCYILALLGNTIFMDKSGDSVHLMWVQQLEDLRNPRRYSWGSACLAQLYRELCCASDKNASQIGGCLLLVQYWAWARFPYLCPTIECGPPVGAYGPPVRGPLSLKWLWVPNKKNKPTHTWYREKIFLMLPDQVVWQPYEALLNDLPPWCIAGRAVWTAMVPLVCFHLVEKHTPDRVVRQFGMIQEIPRDVDTDTGLHDIDLRGRVDVDWMREHEGHITEWGNRLQRCCEAVLGDMPSQHEYFNWFKRVNRRFIDIPNVKLILMNNLLQLADPRRSWEGWIFGCWKIACGSGVTLLVNHSMYDIMFYIKSEAFAEDRLEYSLSARTAELIDKEKFDRFRESNLGTTVILVSGLRDCKNLTIIPEDFKKYREINFRLKNAETLESLEELESFDKRRRRFC